MINKACVKCNESMNGGVYRKPNQCPHCFGLQDESKSADNKLIKTEAHAKTSLSVVVDNGSAAPMPEVAAQKGFPIYDAGSDIAGYEVTTIDNLMDELDESVEAQSEPAAYEVMDTELVETDAVASEVEEEPVKSEPESETVALNDDEKIFDDSTDDSIVEALEEVEEQPKYFENLETRPDEAESLDISLKIEPEISAMEVEDFDIEAAKAKLEEGASLDMSEALEIDESEVRVESKNQDKVLATIKDQILELHDIVSEPEAETYKKDENVVEMSDYSKAEKTEEDKPAEEDDASLSGSEAASNISEKEIEERADKVVAELESNAEIEKVIQHSAEQERHDEDLDEVALLDDVVVAEKVAVNSANVASVEKVASVERIAEIVKQSEIETAKKAVEIAIAKMSSSVDMSDEVADKVAERVVSKVAEKVADKVAEKVVSNIEAEKSEEDREEKKDKLGNDTRYESIILTTESASVLEVERRLDMVTAEFVFDTSMVKSDLSTLKNFSSSSQSVLKDARKTVLDEIKKEAYLLGANTVVDVNLEYSEIAGGEHSMMLVIATGTAVKTRQAA